MQYEATEIQKWTFLQLIPKTAPNAANLIFNSWMSFPLSKIHIFVDFVEMVYASWELYNMEGFKKKSDKF